MRNKELPLSLLRASMSSEELILDMLPDKCIEAFPTGESIHW